MFTRLEFEWLHDHPPLHLLDPSYLWVPTGEDNEGVNDRHWVANRRDAEHVFRRWDTLLDGAEYRAHFGSGPLFVSSEIFMGRTARPVRGRAIMGHTARRLGVGLSWAVRRARLGVGLGSTLTLTLTRA